jgi:hypothetical protein
VLSSVPGVYQDLARDVFDFLQREGVINHGVLPLGMFMCGCVPGLLTGLHSFSFLSRSSIWNGSNCTIWY